MELMAYGIVLPIDALTFHHPPVLMPNKCVIRLICLVLICQAPYWPLVWEKKVDIADPSVSQYLALLQSERDYYKVDYQ